MCLTRFCFYSVIIIINTDKGCMPSGARPSLIRVVAIETDFKIHNYSMGEIYKLIHLNGQLEDQ